MCVFGFLPLFFPSPSSRRTRARPCNGPLKGGGSVRMMRRFTEPDSWDLLSHSRNSDEDLTSNKAKTRRSTSALKRAFARVYRVEAVCVTVSRFSPRRVCLGRPTCTQRQTLERDARASRSGLNVVGVDRLCRSRLFSRTPIGRYDFERL